MLLIELFFVDTLNKINHVNPFNHRSLFYSVLLHKLILLRYNLQINRLFKLIQLNEILKNIWETLNIFPNNKNIAFKIYLKQQRKCWRFGS